MRQALIVVTVVLSTFVPLTAGAQSLVGAWTLEQTEVTGGNNPGTFTGQSGLMIFTATHHSTMNVTGSGTRPQLDENATDAERLAGCREPTS